MRKWRCISVNNGNKNSFTVGKIYETDDNMLNCEVDNGYILTNVKIIEKGDVERGLVFEEVFDEKEEVKMDKFKVGDRVRIIGNCNDHGFKIGETVELCDEYSINFHNHNGYGFRAKKLDGMKILRNIVRTKDLKYSKHSSKDSKTFTITTSDTTTTLTDGTHTTSINRYYADKHDDMVALEEVVKKYKSEMEEIERAEKMPKVGDKVKVVDSGETYDTNKSFLVENKDKINIETIIKWESGELPEKDNVYKVVFKKDNKFIVEDDNSSYIMNSKGLEVIK